MKLIIGMLIGTIVTTVVLYTPKDATEYQFTVIDNCIEVRDYDRTVGTVMLEGKLKQMIDKDNE